MLRTLGPFAVTVDGAPVTGFGYAKVRALLAYLAAAPAQPHARAALAALLWPEQSEAKARGSLSQALLTLRTALGDRAASEPLLLADAQQVQLNPHCVVELDASALRAGQAAAAAHRHRSWRTCARCADVLRQAVEQNQGGFLEDVVVADSAAFEEWVALERSWLLQVALSSLERLVERATWCGATHEAIGYARWLVELDPWQEHGQRTLIQLLAHDGQPAAALAQLQHLETYSLRSCRARPRQPPSPLARRSAVASCPRSAPRRPR